MADVVTSKNGLPIRFTEERWAHIVEEHGELEGLRPEIIMTVAEPDAIYAGKAGELMAVREVAGGKHLVTVYRELTADGFIVTAFLTRRVRYLERRTRLWP